MRILIADQNALLLAAIDATFGPHCEIVTATCRDACMEQAERRKFDVVVACEKLADYTGLELLSEIEATSPSTLRIFAARPETLKRLGKRLDMFGLLGTLSYPIDARKLVVALQVARGRLPRRMKPPEPAPAPAPLSVVRHIVLETEWDTGERLALLEQELEETPAPSAVSPSAAAPSAVTAPSATVTPSKRAATKGPRVRTPSTPTAAQREAFQRALARRNAERASGVNTTAAPRALVGPSETRTKTTATPPAPPSQSLTALARMATTKRPLPGGARMQRATQPKQRVVVFGSGIAAVLLVGVVTFELLRSTPSVDHGRARATGPQLFAPSTLTAGNSPTPMQVFSPPPPEQTPVQAAAPELPQPQTFDPDTAPPDPPPPPALERPGPMEPPSMAHNGPPLGMHEGWNTD